MEEVNMYKIRPAGRHVLTIGEDLIQDKFAALVELVKNSYDADSKDVSICFRSNDIKSFVEIEVTDQGHGMSKDDVISKWMVPSTKHKVNNRKSPRGRIMQGRKGIGRYAASILGDDLLMETVDRNGAKTSLYIEWSLFEQAEYLDEVPVLIENEKTQEPSGTRLIIHGGKDFYFNWSEDELKKLRFELKKLIPPQIDNIIIDPFKISLSFDNFYVDQSDIIFEEIEPYPILELYDYRISGVINSDGKAELAYANNKIVNSTTESINFDFGSTHCGKLVIDIRVYDRDKEAIEKLINRGLKDENTGEYVSKLQARRLLNDVNGIGVYRNGFRIRPLGDSDFDWLKLNEQRVQNPSMKIGSNQVVGYVHIQSEEISNLEEKSARDGLKDNDSYEMLKLLTYKVITELEKRRFAYRRNVGLSNPNKKIERELENLYDYSALTKSISGSLKKAGLSDTIISEVEDIISKDQRKKNKTIDEIKKAVAVYQGQATLGKIINIVLHEGRRPLNYFKNQIPNLQYYAKKFAEEQQIEILEKIVNRTDGIQENADIFSNLFSRLDPLAAKKRETKRSFNICETIEGVKAVFENEILEKNININISYSENIIFEGWRQDFYTIFTNLLDNSIYWIDEKKCKVRNISIDCTIREEKWMIDYSDSGPGIDPVLLESGVIFEPEFTTKPNGTGLGLAIVGEAAQRNGLEIIALQNDKGAHFRLSPE